MNQTKNPNINQNQTYNRYMKGIKKQFELALSSNGLANHRNELFEDIWKEYYPGLKMFCRTYLSYNSDLDDVCQDIMLKVFTLIPPQVITC